MFLAFLAVIAVVIVIGWALFGNDDDDYGF